MAKHLSSSRGHGDTVKRTDTGTLELKDSGYLPRHPQVCANYRALFSLARPGGRLFIVPLSELEFTREESEEQAHSLGGRVRKLSERSRVGLSDCSALFSSSE